MPKFVEGDIPLKDADPLVHGIAPLDDFKQGFAP